MKRVLQTMLVLSVGCGTAGKDSDNDAIIIVDNNATPNSASNNPTGNAATNNGATNGGATNNGSTPLSYAEYVQRYRRTFCDALFDCPNASTVGVLRLQSRYGDAEGCIASPDAPFADQYDTQRGMETGAIAYDPTQAEQCLADLREWLCDGTWGRNQFGIPSCIAASHGTVALGGSCVNSYDCAEGWCGSAETCGSGTCMTSVQECGATTCDYTTQFCDRVTERCTPRVRQGASCDFGQCETPNYCTATQGGMCVPIGSQGSGEACVADFTCVPGLVCDESRCVPPRFGGSGDTCRYSGAPTCEPGLVCLVDRGSVDGICGTPRPAGSSCGADWGCAPGLICDVWNGDVCRPAFDDGDVCQSGAQCASRRCPGGMGSSADGVCEPACTH